MQECDSRHRMTHNSSRIHRTGPAGTLQCRGAESAIHKSSGDCCISAQIELELCRVRRRNVLSRRDRTAAPAACSPDIHVLPYTRIQSVLGCPRLTHRPRAAGKGETARELWIFVGVILTPVGPAAGRAALVTRLVGKS